MPARQANESSNERPIQHRSDRAHQRVVQDAFAKARGVDGPRLRVADPEPTPLADRDRAVENLAPERFQVPVELAQEGDDGGALTLAASRPERGLGEVRQVRDVLQVDPGPLHFGPRPSASTDSDGVFTWTFSTSRNAAPYFFVRAGPTPLICSRALTEVTFCLTMSASCSLVNNA